MLLGSESLPEGAEEAAQAVATLMRSAAARKQGYVLDGFPRNAEDAAAMVKEGVAVSFAVAGPAHHALAVATCGEHITMKVPLLILSLRCV